MLLTEYRKREILLDAFSPRRYYVQSWLKILAEGFMSLQMCILGIFLPFISLALFYLYMPVIKGWHEHRGWDITWLTVAVGLFFIASFLGVKEERRQQREKRQEV